MNSETIIYILIALLAALLLALFQYVYKSKLSNKLKLGLSVLRVISIFGILLLLINPKFETNAYYNEKPTLVVAVDNSESISYLKQNENAKTFVNRLKNDDALNNRFNIDYYAFGKSVSTLDSLAYSERQSNISGALNQFEDVYANQTAAIALLTDGNQTLGLDYGFAAKTNTQPIFPVVLGDSTVYSDLSIKQLNVNRYAFLNNRFPVEIIANYKGEESVTTELKVWNGNALVFRKKLSFSKVKTSEVIATTINANSVGIKTYRAEILPLQNEKNKVNNIKNFGVEVIDQKTNIALVSELLHPDLGALKKAIESNKQRSVSILNPKEFLNQPNDFQLVITYQPNNNFKSVLSKIKTDKTNVFVITGALTDYTLLNEAFSVGTMKSVTNQTEDYQAQLSTGYDNFIVEDIGFSDFPPLKSEFGTVEFSQAVDVLLFKTINGINTQTPMLATYENGDTKQGILLGEGIWRWRAQSFIKEENFQGFDNFINKLVQYLSSNKKRKRLNVDYKTFYNGNDGVIISAQYFNKNYEFDSDASLSIILNNTSNKSVTEIPLLLNKGSYTADLSGISPGDYNFTVKHNSKSIATSGNFKVLDYNVEQQFLNADIEKLNVLAENSEGTMYFSNQTDDFINKLLQDKRFATIQKSTKKTVPLIDWKYLLLIIALSLFAEWFIRKYNGLI